MTNEQYLIVSYFSAAGGGLVCAAATALMLRGRLRRAIGAVTGPVAKVFRRALPAWLVLLVLFAFTSVSYLDCDHSTYQDVVNDRPHMEKVTRRQASQMLRLLAVGLLSYALALAVTLAICGPASDDGTDVKSTGPDQCD